jgi:hypothetical protein
MDCQISQNESNIELEESFGEKKGGLCHHMMLSLLPWREIKDCPGRYVLKKKNGNYSQYAPTDFIYEVTRQNLNSYMVEGISSKMDEKILLVPFPCQGGLLSYVKKDGSYVHTLNTPSGYRRKLEALGIPFEASNEGLHIHNLSLWNGDGGSVLQ